MISEGFFSNPQTPLTEAFTTPSYGSYIEQTNKIGKLVSKHEDTTQNIVAYDALKESVESDEKYADFSGNFLHYSDHPSTVKDAVKEDIHMMILQQNNSYIIGMITVITVMITTYLVTKK